MTLTPNGYRNRLTDTILERYLKSFGAVSIEGPKWCGKTWSARNKSNSEFQMTPNNLSLARIDPSQALIGETPHLIDEWQSHPSLWDEVRFEVDRSGEKGRFILCGSSTIGADIKMHSGAGRIGTIRMHTMSLLESGDSDGAVSLKSLFECPIIKTSANQTSLSELIRYCVRGGWPGLIDNESDYESAVSDYIFKLCNEDIGNIDGKSRNPAKMRMMLKSLARNESTVVSNATIRKDMKDNDDEEIGESTVKDYMNVLEKLNILWYQPSFSTNIRSSTRVGKSPKKHLADPSLSMSLLGLNEENATQNLKTFGFIFEALCERDLLIYSEYNGYTLHHFRDEYGKEIDAVIERRDGSWGAIEIKLGFDQVDEAAENLIKLRDKFNRKPTFLCVLCGTAPMGYRRPDGVYVVPIRRLGP